eukprot:7070582-Alexandrium_andersonii.AAC.1
MEGPGGDHAIIANVITISRRVSIMESHLTFADVKFDLEQMVSAENSQLRKKKKKPKKMSSACAFYLFSYVYDDNNEL